jgi:inner membrane transporter RhtA
VIVLASIAVRSRRNVLAVVLAVGGVYLVTDLRFAGQPIGLLFATLNAILFAGYIILGHRVASSNHIKGIDGPGLSMLIAAIVALPVGITEAFPPSAIRSHSLPGLASGCARPLSRTSSTN